ncbi:hypothetical protein V5799_003846 [Amblyomma americanum]|uniref:Uncharacterized protein n=1 Tax=Amblyomma americanum TaxID=6943 RepID=A0AAQ4D7T0_AMBAM
MPWILTLLDCPEAQEASAANTSLESAVGNQWAASTPMGCGQMLHEVCERTIACVAIVSHRVCQFENVL